MPPVVRSVAAPSGAVAAMWTAEKRRRTIGAPTDTMLMDDDSGTRPQLVQEEQGAQEREEKEFVFSAEDVVDKQERSRCWKMLLARERPIEVHNARLLKLKGKDIEEVYQRLCELRLRDYKRLKEGSLNLDDTTAAVPASEYPDEFFDWDNPFWPGPSKSDWTYDPDYFDLADLNDYQHILPTGNDFDEYPDWEKYRLTFSCYETDAEYVKYWDALSKQMKWVEDAMLLDEKQFLRKYDRRAEQQAMKIAAGFCHLPASLATLGYEEYVSAVRYDLDCRKNYDLVYFEVWKRISNQEMSFIEALKDILSSENKLPPSCLFRIQAQIKGHGRMRRDFSICMSHIRELVGDGGEGSITKKHFTDAVYSKIPRPKMYVDFAKKKLEVARRTHLIPGTGGQRIENRQSDSENRTVR